MSLIKKLAGETAIYGVSSILSRLLNYVFLAAYLTRTFQQEEYGIISELYTYIALLIVFFTFRMETTFFRFASQEKEGNKAFSTASLFVLGLTVIFTLFLLFNAQGIANWLQYPNHKVYVQWFTFIVAADAAAAIPYAKLRLDNRPIRFAIIKTVSVIINIFFIFFFLEICPYLISKGWNGFEMIYNPENRVGYVLIANLVASSVVLLILLPDYFKDKFEFNADLWKKMLWYTSPLVVVGIAAVVNQLINLPMMKALLPGDLVQNLQVIGVYSASYKIAMLMSLFIQAFNYAAEPFFFRQSDRHDAKEIYANVALAFNMAASVVFLGILFYIDILQYFIGPKFRSALDVVPILLLAFWSLGLYYNFAIWYKLTDKTRIGAFISLGGAVITISMNYFLIPQYGYFGAAWAALACFVFMSTAGYLTGRSYYPIPYDIKRILIYMIAAVAVYWVSTLINDQIPDSPITRMLVKTVLLFGYLGVVYLIDKKRIRNLLNS